MLDLRPRVATLLAFAMVLWCSQDASAGDRAAIGAARCALNRAAGPITFLTSSAYAASSGILDVLSAKALGYFDALCLDVSIEPGSANAQLVSAGTAQIAGLGGASDTLVAIDNGARIVGIATYGNTTAIELLSMMHGQISNLRDFSGKTVGYKLAVAPQISAMLRTAGVDPATVNWVAVGYDPIILARGNVSGLTVYRSNEVDDLRSRGYQVREWDPQDYGIRSTFNTQIANVGWAKAHPTAVQDFLRASLHAYDWITNSRGNLDRALGFAQALSTAGYDIASSRRRWQTEAALVAAHQPQGTGIGWQDAGQWQPEADMLVRYKLVAHAPDLAAAQDDSFIAAIYHGTKLIWPAP